MKQFVGSLLVCLGAVGLGANLTAPYALESDAVLPAGVGNPRFFNFFTTLDKKYGESGETLPLGEKLNKLVTWDDVVDAQENPVLKNLVRSFVQNANLDPNGSPGNVTGMVKSQVNVRVPVLGFGITDKLTFAVAVPIVKIDVEVDTGFMRSPEGQRFINNICQSSPEKCNEAAGKLNTATQRKLHRLGYEPLASESVTSIGDIKLITKYRWYHDEDNGLTSKLVVSLPTGTSTNPNKVIDLVTGENRFKLGTSLIYRRDLSASFSAITYAGYAALLPHQVVKRLPTSDTDSLSEDKEELTHRLGHQMHAGAGLSYGFLNKGIILHAHYHFQAKTGSDYDGSDPLREPRYGWLEDLEPSQSLHALSTTLELSTVQWYRNKQFPIPLQTRLTYSKPLMGTNTPSNDLFSGELVLFF